MAQEVSEAIHRDNKKIEGNELVYEGRSGSRLDRDVANGTLNRLLDPLLVIHASRIGINVDVRLNLVLKQQLLKSVLHLRREANIGTLMISEREVHEGAQEKHQSGGGEDQDHCENHFLGTRDRNTKTEVCWIEKV